MAIDLREAVYNVNPLMTPIMQHRLAVGAVAPDDPVALGFTFTPTINGNLYQAPVGLRESVLLRAVPHQGRPVHEHHRGLPAPQRAAR